MPSRSGSATRSRIAPEVLEPVPEAGPLPGGRLQVDPDADSPGSGGGPRRAPRRSAPAPPPRPAPMCAPGWTTRSAIPSASQRSTSTVIASIDLFQRASSGLARLIRYELWATGSTIPVSARAVRKAATCASVSGGRLPLVVVLGEELDGLEADRVRGPDRPVAAPRDRHVGPELGRHARRFLSESAQRDQSD